MKLAIMQPYFFPYLGYFQLINSVDRFIVYDNIKYTKKGWINRNQILQNGEAKIFSINLKKDFDYCDVCDRSLSVEYSRAALLNKLKECYCKAPFYKEAIIPIKRAIEEPIDNLFQYIYYSILHICEFLNIKTEIVISSSLEMDHSLKSKERVMAICKACGAEQYINPAGGIMLYDKTEFIQSGIHLDFLKMNDIIYRQFEDDFVPSLSIIDIMMFNSAQDIHAMLEDYTLI